MDTPAPAEVPYTPSLGAWMHSTRSGLDDSRQALAKRIEDGKAATIIALIMAILAAILFAVTSDDGIISVPALMSIGFGIVAIVFAIRTVTAYARLRQLTNDRS